MEKELWFEPYVQYQSNPPRRDRFDERELMRVREAGETLVREIAEDFYINPFLLRQERSDDRFGAGCRFHFRLMPLVYEAVTAERLSEHCRRASRALEPYGLKFEFVAAGWRMFFPLV